MTSTTPPFLAAPAQLAVLISRFDWASTELGPIGRWPAEMKAIVSMVLRSEVPIVTLWGATGVMIYNDAYAAFAEQRHPRLLGSEVRLGWPEVADFNDNVMRVGLAGGTLKYVDQELTLHRSGRPEQVWLNLDYSPLLDAQGQPCGVMAIVAETTAKVLAERRLGGQRERLRLMFEQAPGFVAMLHGPEHVFDMVNPAYLQLVGHRELVGKPVRQALPEAEGQGFFEILDRVFASGQAFHGTAMRADLQRAVGEPVGERFLDVVHQPLRDDDGRVTGIFVQGTDVTDRVLAEQAARAHAMQFLTFAQAMPNHVWSATPDGLLDWLNDTVSVYSGVPFESLLGTGWTALVHQDDLPGAAASWEEARRTGARYEVEFRLRRHDGVYRWHLARALPLPGDSGGITRWIGTNTDIQDQKAGAQALAHLNDTLEAQVAERTAERDRMWRLSTDVMLVADFEARIVSANPAWASLFGWSEEELIGSAFLDLVHPEDLAATLAEVGKLEHGATTLSFENRMRGRDGSYKILGWTAVPDDRFIHGVGRDVTAEREAAAALRKSEAALYQVQKLESVGQLTGGVAHDFNNLLQVISGNLQLLQRGVVGHERHEKYVANAMAGVRRGGKLASQLLAFARRQPLEPKSINVSRLVTGIEEMLRRTIGESIEIETVIGAGLWNCFVDPDQVENALLNLAINARDAMDGVGHLTVEATNTSLDDAYVRNDPDVKAGQYVMLAVTDTGVGMEPEILAQVFEPFFSTKPEGRGTGLGLSMVFGFAKQSGGHIKIYSEPGHGTTVKLYLPRSVAAEDIDATPPRPAALSGTETILVAEDDDDVRETVVDLLTQLGYTVLKARDAASALSVIEGGAHVDLLFTDVVMPGPLRSPELARLAKQRLPGLEILFTSGYTRNAIVHGGRLDPGIELLGKPYTHDSLAEKVRQLLSRGGRADSR